MSGKSETREQEFSFLQGQKLLGWKLWRRFVGGGSRVDREGEKKKVENTRVSLHGPGN